MTATPEIGECFYTRGGEVVGPFKASGDSTPFKARHPRCPDAWVYWRDDGYRFGPGHPDALDLMAKVEGPAAEAPVSDAAATLAVLIRIDEKFDQLLAEVRRIGGSHGL